MSRCTALVVKERNVEKRSLENGLDVAYENGRAMLLCTSWGCFGGERVSPLTSMAYLAQTGTVP